MHRSRGADAIEDLPLPCSILTPDPKLECSNPPISAERGLGCHKEGGGHGGRGRERETESAHPPSTPYSYADAHVARGRRNRGPRRSNRLGSWQGTASNQKGNNPKKNETLTWNPRLASGRDFLKCAIFARQRLGGWGCSKPTHGAQVGLQGYLADKKPPGQVARGRRNRGPDRPDREAAPTYPTIYPTNPTIYPTNFTIHPNKLSHISQQIQPYILQLQPYILQLQPFILRIQPYIRTAGREGQTQSRT